MALNQPSCGQVLTGMRSLESFWKLDERESLLMLGFEPLLYE